MAENNRNFFSHSSIDWNLKSRSQWAMFPLKALEKNICLVFPASGVTGNSHNPLPHRCIAPISASIFIWPSPCVFVSKFFSSHKDTSLGIRPTLIRYGLILTWLYLQSPCFQIMSHSQVPGFRISTYTFGQHDSVFSRGNGDNLTHETLLGSF